MAYPRYIENGGIFSTTGTNTTCPFPSNIAAGDLLVLTVSKDVTSDATVSTHPSGFTFVHVTENGAATFCMATYYKIAVGTEKAPDFVSLIWSETPANITSSIMYRYSHVAASPFDFGFGDASASSPESTAIIRGGTTLGTERLLMNALMALGDITIGDASGWGESALMVGSVGGNYITAKAQERNVPTATTIPDETSSLSPSAHWIADTFAVIPGAEWPHHFLGVDNANIGAISGVDRADIEAVNTIT